MIGRAIAALDSSPRGWLRRVWGLADIHTRQKWSVLWPHLAALPDHGIRLLDAGCGVGHWSLELASLRPKWEIVGVDIDSGAIASAEDQRRRLALSNVSFVESDFLKFTPAQRFDVILSVASAHYLAEQGRGPELFARFRQWLAPDGLLFLIGPRRARDVRFVSWLASPGGHPVFSAQDLSELCTANDMSVRSLSGCIGPLATFAKQLYWEADRHSTWLNRVLYPVQWSLSAMDGRLGVPDEARTMMWLLIAQAGSSPAGSTGDGGTPARPLVAS